MPVIEEQPAESQYREQGVICVVCVKPNGHA